MKPYTRVDFTGRYNFTEAVSAYLRIENIFDADIEEGMGFKQPGVYSVLGVQYRFF